MGSLTVSTSSVTFGVVPVGQSASTNVAVANQGSASVTISQVSVSGQSFSASGQSNLPVTVNPSSTVNFNVQFDPITAGTATGTLLIASNASGDASVVVDLSGTGTTAPPTGTLSSLSCTNSSIMGSASDSCTVTLSAAAGSSGLTVNLASNDSAVTVPATVPVAAGATSATFAAAVSAVGAEQTATLTASTSSATETFALQLQAVIPALSVSTASMNFGNLPVNGAAAQTLTLTSTGTYPVTISSVQLSGSGFSASGEGFPVTLNPNGTATLSVQFDPTAAGPSSGSVTITSNSTTGSSTVVTLSGDGVPVLNQLTCATGSLNGAGTDNCTVSLNAAAAAGGFTVNLTSNNSAVTVPAEVTVPAGATAASFTATSTAVSSTQSAMLTASANGIYESFFVRVSSSGPTLSVSTTSVSFGEVSINSSNSESITLTSTGDSAVTITAATISGSGFSVSGAFFPLTLSPNQTATLTLQFSPTAAGLTFGTLTLGSNSSSGSSIGVGLSGVGMPVLTGFSCANGYISAAGTDACTVTLNAAAANSGFSVVLASNNAAVSLPPTVTVPGGATSGTFNATVSSVSSDAMVTLTARAYSVTENFILQLGSSVPTLGLSATSLPFGTVGVNSAATKQLILTSTGTAALTINAASISGAGFTVSGANFPLTLAPNQTATLNVQFDPTAVGAAGGNLTLTSNSSTGTSTSIALSGTGIPVLTGLTCASGSMSAAGTDNCTVTLNAAAPNTGFAVGLASNNSIVTLPASVNVLAGASTAVFSAIAGTITSAQTVILSANAGGVTESFALQLGSGTPTLAISTNSLAFGNASVYSPVTQSITLTSTGTAPVTVDSANLSGSGFTVSGAAFPLTLAPNQTATLTVQFDPAQSGAASGSITLVSNSSSGLISTISLSGTGVPVLTGLTCNSASLTGAGNDACTITLNAAAASGGFTVNLASSSSSITVPATVTVGSKATSATFSATVSAASSATAVTLTASAGSATQSFVVQLGTASPGLTINATTIAFGEVSLNSPATQSVSLTSTGSEPVTVSLATVVGAGFTISGASFPLTLNPNQTATLNVEFDPTTAGDVTGTLTIVSTALSNPTDIITLTGTGDSTAYEVNLSWNPPISSTDPIAGYNVYRSPSGGSSYQQINTSVLTQTAFVDTAVEVGQTYDYIVESVDSTGNSSAPSNMASVTTP